MKKSLLVCFGTLILLTAIRAQTGEPQGPKTKADYLQKSKRQKIGGFIFLGLGAAAIGIAAPGNVDFDILPVLVIGGGACIVTSVVLFVCSAKNNKRANNLSAAIKFEGWDFAGTGNSYPALALRIGL